jgi:hypothetical protein
MLPPVVECRCLCHYPTHESVMFHFAPCCEGKCHECGLWFLCGREVHVRECVGLQQEFAMTSDRKTLDNQTSYRPDVLK